MKYKAVIFDLFGTLVENLPESEYRSMLVRAASTVLADEEQFISLWNGYSKELFTGDRNVAECIGLVCNRMGLANSDRQLSVAYNVMTDPVRQKLKPESDILVFLSYLNTWNLKVGLISNCSSEVPILWKDSPLAPMFKNPIFSCSVGLTKPDPRIYLLATEWLRVKPNECLFVDDNLRFLIGAASVGMHSALIREPTEEKGTMRRVDPETDTWNGAVISSLKEVVDLMK